MRFDSVGLFWEDIKEEKKKGIINRVMPPIPETGWKAPTYFPNLKSAPVISLDCETFDPELDDNGPGWARGVGHIVGVSIAVDDQNKWYFPIRHTVATEDNLNPENVVAWLRDTLNNPVQPKIGANLMYDIGWLRNEGVDVAGPFIDVQYAEALLNERAPVNLDALGQKYLGIGKETSLLYDWCSQYYGGPATSEQRKNIYRSPPKLVGPYAEADAYLPLQVARKMYPLLKKENLLELFELECGLIPLLVDMRFAGVQVNIERAEQLRESLIVRQKDEQDKLNSLVGFNVEINAAASLARAFETLGLAYGRTAKGNPSFTKAFLESFKHPITDCIKNIRKFEKLRGTFIESYILNSHKNGMVYGQFHPLRGDGFGTRSGRLSSSTPNLQNIPARDDELAPLVRGLFIPDSGHLGWRKYDYSQIEYRFLIHFAVGKGAEEARIHFNEHPETDYHDMTLDMVAPFANWDTSTKTLRKQHRRPIKNINFGLIFGMGVEKLSGDLGLSTKEGKKLFAAYHEGVPFAKATMNQCSEIARETGVITTILGRKSRFDLWEPRRYMEATPLPYFEALRNYGDIVRAETHKALNRRLQGSAADLMKKAMYLSYINGVFKVTGVPRLTVHDELDFSDPGGADEAFKELVNIMETAIPIKIPIKVVEERGPDWGHTREVQ